LAPPGSSVGGMDQLGNHPRRPARLRTSLPSRSRSPAGGMIRTSRQRSRPARGGPKDQSAPGPAGAARSAAFLIVYRPTRQVSKHTCGDGTPSRHRRPGLESSPRTTGISGTLTCGGLLTVSRHGRSCSWLCPICASGSWRPWHHPLFVPNCSDRVSSALVRWSGRVCGGVRSLPRWVGCCTSLLYGPSCGLAVDCQRGLDDERVLGRLVGVGSADWWIAVVGKSHLARAMLHWCYGLTVLT
jgi:hypothetical protein